MLSSPYIRPDASPEVQISLLAHGLTNLRIIAERQQVKRTHIHLACLIIGAAAAIALLVSGAVVMSTTVAALAEPIALILERMLDL